MKPLPFFELHLPHTLNDALELMASLDAVKAVAGGTDLLPLMREAECAPKNLVDLNNIPELNYIEEKDGYVHIGATVTLTQLLANPLTWQFPALIDSVGWIGSPQIRNRGTLAGNIINASPAADSGPPLLVHEAEVTVKSLSGRRIIPIDEFFQGPKINCLEPDELLTEVNVPVPPLNSSSRFKRIGRRKAFTLSVVSAAVYIRVEDNLCKDARVAFGSVDVTPIRVHELEEMLLETDFDDKGLLKICGSAKDYVEPITDIRGTAEYRREMCGVLMRRALNQARERVGDLR